MVVILLRRRIITQQNARLNRAIHHMHDCRFLSLGRTTTNGFRHRFCAHLPTSAAAPAVYLLTGTAASDLFYDDSSANRSCFGFGTSIASQAAGSAREVADAKKWMGEMFLRIFTEE